MTQHSPILIQAKFSYKENLKSSASLVCCYVCGKGLEEGRSITTKALPGGIVLFCNLHYSGQ